MKRAEFAAFGVNLPQDSRRFFAGFFAHFFARFAPLRAVFLRPRFTERFTEKIAQKIAPRFTPRFALRFAALALSLAFFGGCGYLPMSFYAKQSIGENIYVESVVSLSDPENSVIAKDALNLAVMTRFQSGISDKQNADTTIHIELSGISIYSISDSRTGFANFYRANVSMNFRYKDKSGAERSFHNVGSYDFALEPNSTLTDEKRFAAISEASLQGIDRFIAQVAYHYR